MSLNADAQIRRKILRLLSYHGGLMGTEEWRQIEAGAIPLDQYLAELIVQGCIQHEPGAKRYILTDSGRTELARLQGDDPSGSG